MTLLVLIGLVLVAVVGTFVVKMIRENATVIENADLYIDPYSPAPFYYAATGRVYLTLARGSDKANIDEIKILIYTADSSKTFSYTVAPALTEKEMYAPGQFSAKPVSLEVAVLVSSNSRTKQYIIDKADIIDSSQLPAAVLKGLDTYTGSSTGSSGSDELPPENVPDAGSI